MAARERAGENRSPKLASQLITSESQQARRLPLGEILRFLLVGGAAAALDLFIYLMLKNIGLPVPASKGASFVIASGAAYFGNKHFTYSRNVKSSASILLYGLLYTCTLVINVLVNDGLLELLRLQQDLETGLAWGLATAVSAILNFVGTKLLIFRGKSIE